MQTCQTVSYAKTALLFQEYSDLVQYGEQEQDEALQNAVEWAFRDKSDTFQNELYCNIWQAWQDETRVELRFIITEKAIQAALGTWVVKING